VIDDRFIRVERLLPRETLFHPRWFLRCEVSILVVTDSGSGGFGDEAGFHLGQILKILSTDPWSHVRFVVTKAHRQTTGEADVLENFRFDLHDLSGYSQIWLFGINTTGPDPLGAAELKTLAQFMDQGGGVFATGDHENLGQAMCAEVPRVRSMRRWYYPSPGPNGEPVAPAQVGAERHDTVVNLPLGNQSDAVPQPITPKWYSRRSGGAFIHRIDSYPHPLLCGPDGVIEYLPDHMHEGCCEVPSDLGQSFTFDGYTTTEYPGADAGGEKPRLVACARTRNTDNTEFGVIAAYDGHAAGVGRVVVDATWHHWFNINLMGFLAATDPASPAYDPTVVPKWEAIKAYYRNVAAWLARPSLQGCLRRGGWLSALGYYDILITHRELRSVTDPLAYYWQLGVFARDALGRLASRCQRTRWEIELLEELKPPFRIDPWRVPPRPQPDPPPWLDLDQLERVALGGAVHALMEKFRDEPEPQRLVERDEVDAVATAGAAQAAGELLARFKAAGKEADRLAKALAERR